MRPIFLLRGICRMCKRQMDIQSRAYRVYRLCVAQCRICAGSILKSLNIWRDIASDAYMLHMFQVILSRGMVILMKIACKIGFGGHTQAALIPQRRFPANRL